MKTINLILIALIAIFLYCCTSPESNTGQHSGHTVNKAGVYHMTGLDDPETNCVQCHGNDLRGGTSGVSCYQCHGQVW
jgi:hypothetical protein